MRSDRTLGTKPYNNAPRRVVVPAKPRRFDALRFVLRNLLIAALAAGFITGLAATASCQVDVRCAD